MVSATLVCTPFLLDYDLVCLSLPIAWIVAEAQRTEWQPWEKIVVLAAYAMPLLSQVGGNYDGDTNRPDNFSCFAIDCRSARGGRPIRRLGRSRRLSIKFRPGNPDHLRHGLHREPSLSGKGGSRSSFFGARGVFKRFFQISASSVFLPSRRCSSRTWLYKARYSVACCSPHRWRSYLNSRRCSRGWRHSGHKINSNLRHAAPLEMVPAISRRTETCHHRGAPARGTGQVSRRTCGPTRVGSLNRHSYFNKI